MVGTRGAPAEREVALAETFVLLADALVGDFDLLELFYRLMNASVGLLDVAAAALVLDDQHGHLQVVASSSEDLRVLEIFQLQNNEGPSAECVRRGAVVSSNDITGEWRRWPSFGPRAVEAGFNAVAVVPMRLRNQTIGALSLFQSDRRMIGDDQRRLAQALADVATIGIVHRRDVERTTVLTDQLQYALDSRVVIEQAKGIVAERHKVSMEVAFQALRRHARDNNRKIADTAEGVIRGGIDPTRELLRER